MESLLTIKEVTAKLKISRMTLHKLTTGKKLPCYKIGRQIRYKVEDVEKFLSPESQTQDANQEAN
jgi:excisionase family DNA binding protein